MDESKRVSLSDIARACEVSNATVSYVLNETPGHTISAETRRRVLDTALRLGYVPNSAAKALRVGRTQIVLLDTSGVMDGVVLRAFMRAFSDHLQGAGVTVITWSRSVTPLSRITASVAPFAVAALTPFTRREVAGLRRAGVRYIAGEDFGGRLDAATRQRLDASDREQVRYLASIGHTHIGYANPTDPAMRCFLAYRGEQARDSCRRLGLHQPVQFEVSEEPALVTETLRRLRARTPEVTAIAAANDDTAFPILAAAHRLGIRIPEDLAVIGFDDVPLARHAYPALTTVRIEGAQLGVDLAALLLEAMGGPTVEVDPGQPRFSLIVRDST